MAENNIPFTWQQYADQYARLARRPTWGRAKLPPGVEQLPGYNQPSMIPTDSAGAYSWADQNAYSVDPNTGQRYLPGHTANPYGATGGVDQRMPNMYSIIQGAIPGGTDYGQSSKWNTLQDLASGRFNATPGTKGFDPLTTNDDDEKSIWGKAKDWIGDNPMKAAGIGLDLWKQINQNRALSQNKAYMDDVRKAMAFDQADVNRRWDLTMKDYNRRVDLDDKFLESQKLPTAV